MMKRLCFVYLFSVLIAVSSNPLGQLIQSYNTYQPTLYSNPASIPVVIQQPSNTNPYNPPPIAQISAGCPGPLGETLNQIVLNRILSNPSLQKIVDPNTRLFNQNGEEVRRHIPKGSGVPNVINNYFIVPPEFFNLNETVARNENQNLIALVDHTVVRKPRRRKLKKLKKRQKKVELSSTEDDDGVPKSPIERQKQKKTEEVKQKRKRINAEESLEIIDAIDEPLEINIRREKETARHKRKRLRKKNTKEQTTIPPNDESDEGEEKPTPKHKKNKHEIERLQNDKSKKSKTKVVKEVSEVSVSEQPKRKKINDDIVVSRGKVSEFISDTPVETKTKKEKRKESSAKQSEQNVLKDIEIPTDISNRDPSEKRKTRDSKRNAAKKEPEKKLTPFPDDVVNNFFPYMPPVGNFYNPNSNYPYNFDQYYQYLNPGRNSNPNRNITRRKNKNRKNKEPNSNTHTIEVKLKPKNKENTTETITPEKSENVSEVVKMEQSTESFEQVTDIPMEMPHKVTPIKEDEVEFLSKENYETFSKLEELHEFITPELGKEDEIPPMNNNGIINDYYPVFDDDVYYNPYVETVKNLDDDRYFYDTGTEANTNKEKRKLDRYEDSRSSNRDTDKSDIKNADLKIKKNRSLDTIINEFDHNEYLDTIKSSAEIIRVKVPPKNTRVKAENVETVYAGSKVARYGVPLDETCEDTSTYVENSDESSYTGDGQTTYVIAKSLGPPEDYW